MMKDSTGLAMAVATAMSSIQLEEAKSRVHAGIRVAPKTWKKKKSRLKATSQSRKANRR